MQWLKDILGLQIEHVLKMKIITSFIEYLAHFHSSISEIEYAKADVNEPPFPEIKYEFVDDQDGG